MRLNDLQNKIQFFLSLFVAQVKAARALSKTDINHVAETVLVPLFAEIYGYRDLRNLNDEQPNYPGIDLGDDTARVAFQITATTSSTKIKETLEKFVEHKLFEKYDHLIFYLLSDKQNSYSGRGFDDIVKGRFTFDKDKDIQDFTDILKKVAGLSLEKVQRVERILDAHFGDGNAPLFTETDQPKTEIVYLNLLEIFFPDTLYMAEISLDRKAIIQESHHFRTKLRNDSPQREVVRAALEQQGLRFGVDWVCHAGQLITFHDLEEPFLPLAQVIDSGTITSLDSDEFYGIDENYERVFKELLWRCMRQKLFHLYVQWQNEEHLFIFAKVDDSLTRKEEWQGSKITTRTVYERKMKPKKPDEISYCKHLAFQTEYICLDDKWYVQIKPEWFFSSDGYRKSFFAGDRIKYLKRMERNAHVFNHVRFIAYFLKHQKPPTLFQQTIPYRFLHFGTLLNFDSAPYLNDEDWLPGEDKQERNRLEDTEDTQPLLLEP